MMAPPVDAFTLTMDAKPTALRDVRASLRTWLADAEVSDSLRSDIVLAVDEAVSNCVEHAIPPGPDHSVEFSVMASFRGDELFVTVADNGRWLATTVRDGKRGRGIPLMVSLMTTVDVSTSPNGTSIHMSLKM